MNLAGYGGAVHIEKGSSIKGHNVKMNDNVALVEGGAINVLHDSNVNLT